MNFGEALEQLKQGKQVARKGWNGKNQYVFLIEGALLTQCLGPAIVAVPCTDVLAIKTSSNVIQIGWLATQSDMLSDDWEVVE
jgi:hypothetical protein